MNLRWQTPSTASWYRQPDEKTPPSCPRAAHLLNKADTWLTFNITAHSRQPTASRLAATFEPTGGAQLSARAPCPAISSRLDGQAGRASQRQRGQPPTEGPEKASGVTRRNLGGACRLDERSENSLSRGIAPEGSAPQARRPTTEDLADRLDERNENSLAGEGFAPEDSAPRTLWQERDSLPRAPRRRRGGRRPKTWLTDWTSEARTGWEAGIRTPILRSRAVCLTLRRPPS
jgi:hypothetical protein